MPAAAAASEDPFAEIRADTLAVARAAAEAARAAQKSKSEKKKRARDRCHSDTPEAKQQQMDLVPAELQLDP